MKFGVRILYKYLLTKHEFRGMGSLTVTLYLGM